MKFKKNLHVAKGCRLEKINKKIANYDQRYKPPKYLFFIKYLLENGWSAKIYEAGVSKYVFVRKQGEKDEDWIKIRFSNHKPIFQKQQENDCDFYVGISHGQVHTTEEIINILTSPKLLKV